MISDIIYNIIKNYYIAYVVIGREFLALL
jgi:hypothetical protein